jgi:plasmid replication initiation protein
LDLFVAVYDRPSLKADLFSLEHPFFVLTKHRFTKTRVYEHGEVRIEVIPSSAGAPTQWDKDVLIYAQAQMTQALNEGRMPTRTFRFRAYDLLITTRRGVTGNDYNRLKSALTRLRGATITTTIKTGVSARNEN